MPPQADKWEQYAEPTAGDKWEMYAETPEPNIVSKTAKAIAGPAPIPPAGPNVDAMEGARQARAIRSREGTTAANPQPETGLTGAFERLGQGLEGTANAILFPKGNTEGERLADIWHTMITDPLHQEFAKSQDQGISPVERAGHRVASYIPVLGPMAASAGTVLGRGDYGGLVDAAVTLAGARGLRKGGPMDALAEDASKFNPHLHAMDSAWRFAGHKLLSDAVNRVRAKVGDYSNRISQADQAATQAAGGVPTMSVTPAFNVVDQAIQSRTPINMPRSVEAKAVLDAQRGAPLGWDRMKDTRTEVGRLLESARRTDPTGTDAATLGAAYKALSDEMSTRAQTLGHTDTFKQFNKLNTQLERAHNGPIGKALEEDPNPLKMRDSSAAGFWGHLFNPEFQEQLNRSFSDLKEYGLDDRFLQLRNELRPIFDVVTNKGRLDWRTRLALAGAFTAAGVPHAFLTAYTAMYFPEMAKAMKAAMAERAMPEAAPGPGTMFSPPMSGGGGGGGLGAQVGGGLAGLINSIRNAGRRPSGGASPLGAGDPELLQRLQDLRNPAYGLQMRPAITELAQQLHDVLHGNRKGKRLVRFPNRKH